MAYPDTKSLIDQGLSTAITCSFAIPEVGPGLAAVLASGKFFFDIFYPPDSTGKDPLKAMPTLGDLQKALSDLQSSIATNIWANTKAIDQAGIIAMSDGINTKIRNAGASKLPYSPMPGDTVVWVNSVVDQFWAPIDKNPSDIDVLADLIEAKASEKFRSVGLYTLAIGVYLTYCKTAMLFEVNENLKDYQARHSAWDALDQAHKNWAQAKTTPEPPLPGKEPSPPTDGDYAVQSEMIDPATKVVSGYRSYLGKAKGEPSSIFAQKAKDQVDARLVYLKKLVADHAQAKLDRKGAVDAVLDQVTVETDTSSGTTMYYWKNAITGDTGDPVTFQAMASAQADAEKGKLRAIYEKRWNTNNVNPDDLTDSDIAGLNATITEWMNTSKALAGVSSPLLSPPNTH